MTMTATELRDADRLRSAGWHHKRRARGVCAMSPCTRKPETNPRTGRPYWACRSCRAARRAEAAQ
jgi:hypothetical protein